MSSSGFKQERMISLGQNYGERFEKKNPNERLGRMSLVLHFCKDLVLFSDILHKLGRPVL